MIVEDYISRLDANTHLILDRISSFGPDEILFNTEGRWNILEIAEHILITEKSVFKLLQKKTETQSENAELFGQEKLHRWLVDLRSRKVKAPAYLEVKGLITSKEQFQTHFRESREAIKTALQSGHLIIDNRTYQHPVMGAMTVRDWLNFLISHAQRHLLQMEDNAAEFTAKK